MLNINYFVKIRRTFLQLDCRIKIKPMEDKDIKEFSWTAFLLVTGFCFFFFSKILERLDGEHLPLFTWIGIIAIVSGSINSIRTLMERTEK
jgi:hypothetical protein